MIGNNLSRATNRKLTLWGTVALFGFYILCVVQGRQWTIYSVVCAPTMVMIWIWGLGAYKRPTRETGKIANFATLHEMSFDRITDRVTEIAGSLPTEFQRGQLVNVGGLLARPDPHPGGTPWSPSTILGASIKFDVVKTIKLMPPSKPVRVSRYKRVSDPTLWFL